MIAMYSFAAPRLNDRLGWDLPTVNVGEAQNEAPPETRSRPSPSPSATTPRAPSTTAQSEADFDPGPDPTNSDRSDSELQYGLLREVSRDRFLSPAGLLYTPGSAEGHRLKHLRRHVEDDPNRPGRHGVFDGGMEGALVTIDRAYERAKKNQKTTTTQDDGRTIFTVDMGGRVGYVGGRDGNRQRRPMARRVRMVLDGNRVITAYPM